MNKNNIDRIDEFLDKLSKEIVNYMKKNNVSIFAALSTNVIELIPRCSKVYEYISWNHKKEDHGDISYESKNLFLRDIDKNGKEFPAKFTFDYQMIKWKIFRNYLSHNIKWR